MENLIVLECFEIPEHRIWSKTKHTTNKAGTRTEEKAEDEYQLEKGKTGEQKSGFP